LPGYKLLGLRSSVNKVLKDVVQMNVVDFGIMIKKLEFLKNELKLSGLLFGLDMDELIGAFFSELSRELE
jgi:hypothetical protein